MVTNIAHWDLSGQYIKEDSTFADTLVSYMRRMNVTAIFVGGDDSGTNIADIQRPILDHADVVFEFERIDFHGERRVTLRTTKSRDMKHSKHRYEIGVDTSGMFVRPTGGLLREGADGESRSVPLRFFVNAETDPQRRYNARWNAILKGVVSEDAVIQTDSTAHIVTNNALSRQSAVDELQIYQIDEFQAPRSLSRGGAAEWSMPLSEKLLGEDGSRSLEFVPEISSGLRSSASPMGKSYSAVPYCADVGFLVTSGKALPEFDHIHSWDDLCAAQDRWYSNQGSDTLFFGLPENLENLNCLFFEILFEILQQEVAVVAPGVGGNVVSLDDMCRLLCSPAARRALKVFRELMYRCYRRRPRAGRYAAKNASPKLRREPAIVSRHWYSTLHDIRPRDGNGKTESLKTRPLPNQRSVAGEWFLCVPKHSAGVETATEIIRQLTSPEQEVTRLAIGVGLPVRLDFYQPTRATGNVTGRRVTDDALFAAGVLVGDSLIGREAILDQIRHAIRRSYFTGYAKWTRALSSALENILGLEVTSSEWESFATECLAEVSFNVKYASGD